MTKKGMNTHFLKHYRFGALKRILRSSVFCICNK